jgi:hypothetical protein
MQNSITDRDRLLLLGRVGSIILGGILMRKPIRFLLSIVMLLSFCSCSMLSQKDEKPVIYLYPAQKTDVKVKLDYRGELTCTYPVYQNGWEITAFPDGKIINKADQQEYSYLFWEGKDNIEYDLSKGFVIKGSDTTAFLKQKLEVLGLTPKEYNEFIVYWLPQMQNNPYNLITFQNETYTDNAKLSITPKPDSMLRVFMAYKPLDKFVEIPQQKLKSFERKGFAVVEWGGTQVK